MIYVKSNELYHHGIKGQRWGIRRYQNPDGTLTEAGKKRQERYARYARGGQIAQERKQIRLKTYEHLTKTDPEYTKAYNEAMRIARKYGLDMDDGGGGDRTRWTEEQLERAGKRYWDYSEDYAARQEVLEDSARRHADSEILKKYGDVGVSDMQYYENVNSAIGFGIFAVAAAGAVALTHIIH